MAMAKAKGHREQHLGGRAGWLRAAVLGANDAILSTSSLMIGVGQANPAREAILIAGVAGLVAGAMSMAAGELVSVSAQRDSEEAEIGREKHELATAPEAEIAELTQIYQRRGLDEKLARAVAEQLTHADQLGTHLRDELGIDPHDLARPWQAAWSSAASFAIAALVPIGALLAAPAQGRTACVAIASLFALALLGGVGAHLGSARKVRAVARVVVGGALAMGVTAAIGHVVGAAV